MLPGIAQAWGKRRVTIEDIRRLVGILDDSTRGIFITQDKIPIYLTDYGHGKICIELHQDVTANLFSEERLKRAFEKGLRRKWASRDTFNVQQFIASLPKATAKQCESIAKMSGMLAKGQRTLDEFNASIARKKQEKETQVAADTLMASPNGTTEMSLLDRIRYKQQLAQASGLTAPTPAELQRRAALQRVEDIASVLAMLGKATALGNGQKRVSFSMTAVLTKLKDSLRTPISREESAACVRMLAREVAPQWLKIVTIGSRENLVILTDCAPTKTALQERVVALSA